MSVDNINETTEVADILENEEETEKITATIEEKKKAINLLDLKYVKKFILDKIKSLHDIFYKKTDTVAKATGDEDGNNIKGTYLKKSDLPDVPGASVAYAAEAGHATSADTAAGDEDGNNIKSTYATKAETSGVSGITIDENGVMKRVLDPIDRSFNITFGAVTVVPSGSMKGKITITAADKNLDDEDGAELKYTKDDGTTIFGTVDIQTTNNQVSGRFLRYYTDEDFGIYANQTISVEFNDNREGIPVKNEIIISQKQLIWEKEFETPTADRHFTNNDYLKNCLLEQAQKNRKLELEIVIHTYETLSTILMPITDPNILTADKTYYQSMRDTITDIGYTGDNNDILTFVSFSADTPTAFSYLDISLKKHTATGTGSTNVYSIRSIKLYAIIE